MVNLEPVRSRSTRTGPQCTWGMFEFSMGRNRLDDRFDGARSAGLGHLRNSTGEPGESRTVLLSCQCLGATRGEEVTVARSEWVVTWIYLGSTLGEGCSLREFHPNDLARAWLWHNRRELHHRVPLALDLRVYHPVRLRLCNPSLNLTCVAQGS